MARRAELSPEEVGRLMRELSQAKEAAERLGKRVYELERRERLTGSWRDGIDDQLRAHADELTGLAAEVGRQSVVDTETLLALNTRVRASRPPSDPPVSRRGKMIVAVATAIAAVASWLASLAR